ncbi:MAG: DUF3073 domain-containing protein [bacterium]
MGRGRAKAKQQKVARDLKYNTPATDLDSLQRELGSPSGPHGSFDETDDGSDTDDLERWASGSR